MIPKLTHQTAATTDLTAEQHALRDRLKKLHPDWEHKFYCDDECRDIIRTILPSFLPIYDAYPTNIQRTDLFRVAVVYAFGGFYLDLDVACETSLSPLIDHDCVLAEESTLSADAATRLGHNERLRIANYMFAARPHHPFWLDILEEIAECATRPVNTENDILESTGPGLFSRVYGHVNNRHNDLTLLAHPGTVCERCGGQSCQFGIYARHLHHGSWRWQHVGPPSDHGAKVSTETAKRSIGVLRQSGKLAPSTVVLQTYDEAPVDGLTTVFDLVRPLGPVVKDTRNILDHRVIVAGLSFAYLELLSPANTNILYTTFETSKLPDHWVHSINQYYHHCIVPHERVRRVFEACGVRVPLSVIPQSFTRYPSPDVKPEPARIGFLGVPVRRKNLHALHRACQSLLPRWPNLKLAIHVATWYDWLDPQPFAKIKADPMVDWTEGRLNPVEMGMWYRRLNCYAYPSRAEGWSLTPRESMFLGVPTVLSDIEMHRDLIGSAFCHPIPSHGKEPAQYEFGVIGEWDTITANDIAAVLNDVLSNSTDAQRKATQGAKMIENKWLASDTQAALAELISQL